MSEIWVISHYSHQRKTVSAAVAGYLFSFPLKQAGPKLNTRLTFGATRVQLPQNRKPFVWAAIYLTQYGSSYHTSLVEAENDEVWWFSPIGTGGMKKVNVFTFYRFGSQLKEILWTPYIPIPPLKVNEPVELIHYPIDACIGKVHGLCSLFLLKTADVNLPTARENIEKLRDLVAGCAEAVGKMSDQSEREREFRSCLHRCNFFLERFEEALKYDMSRINAVIIPRKGIYDSDDLMERADEHFSPEVRKHLPATAIHDFKEAGRCLIFNCYTAMGYHIVRGVEAVTLKYLETAKGAPYKGDPGLGQYIGALQARKLAIPTRILQRLDELRKYERNPIAHPDFVIEADEALPMYNLAHGVVPMMANEIERIENEKSK